MNRTEQERGREELVRALASRFVELRRKAGMTQFDVAEAMGRERSGQQLVSRFESIGFAKASLAWVVEYLRAVRTGFGSLKDALDRYTSKPIPRPAQKLAEATPLPRAWKGGRASALLPGTCRGGLALASGRNQESDLATVRAQRRAGYWVLRKVFEHFLHTELNAIGASPAVWMRRRMAQYGRKVFNALFRTRGPKEPKRAERLARLREWALKQHLTEPIAEYLELVVRLAFEDMGEHDELDWVPPPAEAYAIMALKPKRRVVTDAQMCLEEWWDKSNRYFRAAQEAYERAHKAATDLLPTADSDARTFARYQLAAMRATNIASTTAPGTPRRKQSVAEFHATAWPPDLDRKLLARVLAAALQVWDASRSTLPPAPGPRPR